MYGSSLSNPFPQVLDLVIIAVFDPLYDETNSLPLDYSDHLPIFKDDGGGIINVSENVSENVSKSSINTNANFTIV